MDGGTPPLRPRDDRSSALDRGRYYRFAVIDGYLDRSPAEYVRGPHVPEESQVLGLDRMQLRALVATARASTPDEAALITMLGLLGLLGLRIGEACTADVQDMGTQRGHRPLHIIGKGNKPALVPLPVPVARTLDLAAGERTTGPLLRMRTGRRMDRNAASRIVHRLAKRAGIEHHVGCHALRHAFITVSSKSIPRLLCPGSSPEGGLSSNGGTATQPDPGKENDDGSDDRADDSRWLDEAVLGVFVKK